MGRIPQHLVAALLATASFQASAIDFYKTSWSGLYTQAEPIAREPTDTCADCDILNYATQGPTGSCNTISNTTLLGFRVNYKSRGTGNTSFKQIGCAYTCTSGRYWNGSLTAPSCGTAPICTPPQVIKPGGTCGPPCTTGDPYQVSGKSTLSLGKPDPSVCVNSCKYMLTQDTPDPDAFTKTVLGTNAGGLPEYSWTAVYKGNSAACSMSNNPDAPKPDSTPDFLQGGNTKTTVQWPNHGPCGYVDGTYKCKGVSPPGTCGKTSDGGAQCETPKGTAPASPPGPDNGTAGTPALPVATVTNNTTTTSFYNTSTVVNSTGGMGNISTPTPGTGTTGGTSPTAAQMPGSSENPAEIDCEASGTCTNGDGNYTGSAPEVKDFSTSLNDFQSGVASSPIASAFTGIGSGMPTGGTAPSATFEIFGHNFTLAVPAEILSAITPVLALIMKLVWSLIAIRRFMSA